VQRAQSKRERNEAVTLAKGMREYVDAKRRKKDGLPLKARTKADYLAMVTVGKVRKNGDKARDGELYALAKKSIHKITGDDIRAVHAVLMKRGERRAAYAMQVLRAVLGWHGVRVPGDPLGKDVPGRDRISIPQARAKGGQYRRGESEHGGMQRAARATRSGQRRGR
jgi:hypothetical protein